ncbi:MAG: DUF1127 domain-containing protein [Hyphomicrobiales bacterium]
MLFFKELRRWRENNRSITQLNGMSSRELRDMGISRSEIPDRVRGSK